MESKWNFTFVSYGTFEINLVEKISPLECKLKNELSKLQNTVLIEKIGCDILIIKTPNFI